MKPFSFGVSVVNAGQRNVNVRPQFVAVSTSGSFRVSAPVTAALRAQAGDNLMFLNNISEVDYAIQSAHPAIVDWCTEHSMDIADPETVKAIHAEFDIWMIAKGIQEFDAKGIARTCTERLTMKDKMELVKQDFDATLEKAMESGNEELVAALTADGITRDQQVEILAGCIEGREIPKFKGSRLGSPTGQSGIGTTLTCSDSNVWYQLKADLGEEEKTKVNRVFEVNLDEPQTLELNDGFKVVKVTAYALGEYTDETPLRVGRRGADDANEAEE